MSILRIFRKTPEATGTAAAPVEVRPLAPIADVGRQTWPLTAESFVTMLKAQSYSAVVSYLSNYPPRSVMSDHSRAVLFTLIRALCPRVVAEVGTMYAGTTEVMARALWENGEGVVYTTDPLGGDRCPAIIAHWPKELRDRTHFRPLNSMDFFHELDRKRVTLDLVLVDGNHDFEFALFDLQMAARLLRPGGIVIMDNGEQTGPFKASKVFITNNPAWRELGDAISSFDPARPFDAARASIQGTSFIVLQAPDHISINIGPHSWGQVSTKASLIKGFTLELPHQITSGTLYYQAIFRAFLDDGAIPEVKALGSINIKTADKMTVAHVFDEPLQMPDRAQYTFEIDISWSADLGSAALRLAGPPVALV